MRKSVSIVIATLALLLVWQAASLALDKAFLPTPLVSFRAFWDLCVSGEMWPQFGISAMRVLVSTALGVLLAVPLGMACGRSERLYHVATPLVAILWGRKAQTLAPLLNNAFIITSPHPSPLSASRGFFGSKPFSRTNEALIRMGAKPVDWSLPAADPPNQRLQ